MGAKRISPKGASVELWVRNGLARRAPPLSYGCVIGQFYHQGLFQGEFGGEPGTSAIQGGGFGFFLEEVGSESGFDVFGLDLIKKEMEAGGKPEGGFQNQQGVAPFFLGPPAVDFVEAVKLIVGTHSPGGDGVGGGLRGNGGP